MWARQAIERAVAEGRDWGWIGARLDLTSAQAQTYYQAVINRLAGIDPALPRAAPPRA